MTCIIYQRLHRSLQKSRQPSNPTIGSLSFSSGCGRTRPCGVAKECTSGGCVAPRDFPRKKPQQFGISFSKGSPEKTPAPHQALCKFLLVFFGRTQKIPDPAERPKRKVHRFFWVFGWSLFLDSNPNVLTQEWSGRVLRIFSMLMPFPRPCQSPKRANLTFTFQWHPQRVNKTHISPTSYSWLRHGPRELFLFVKFQCLSLANKESSKVIVRKHLRKDESYLKVKIDGLPIPKGGLVKGPKINQYVGTVSHLLFRYCK